MTENKIFEYLNGQLSTSDSLLVEQWIAESDANKNEFEDLNRIFDQTVRFSDEFNPDVAAAWKKVETRLFSSKEAIQVNWVNWRMISRIAAVVVLAIGLGYFVKQQIDKEQLVTISTLDNQIRDIKLSDGTLVTLNENSELTFAKTFKGEQRNVSLKGQAFFDVKRDELKPFLIHGLIGNVEVLGTSFDVLSTDRLTTVNVASGKVALSSIEIPEKKVFLEVGQQGILKGGTLLMHNSIDENRISWRYEELDFKSAPLSEVIEILSKHYKVKFELDNNLNNCLITSSFKRLELSEVLKTLELIANIKNTQEKGLIKLSGPGC